MTTIHWQTYQRLQGSWHFSFAHSLRKRSQAIGHFQEQSSQDSLGPPASATTMAILLLFLLLLQNLSEASMSCLD